MKCTVCQGRAFCLCNRLLERKPIWNRGQPGGYPIDQALEETQRMMDARRDEKIRSEMIRVEALYMAEALVKILKGDAK
jgi:hypothetical protein